MQVLNKCNACLINSIYSPDNHCCFYGTLIYMHSVRVIIVKDCSCLPTMCRQNILHKLTLGWQSITYKMMNVIIVVKYNCTVF